MILLRIWVVITVPAPRDMESWDSVTGPLGTKVVERSEEKSGR